MFSDEKWSKNIIRKQVNRLIAKEAESNNEKQGYLYRISDAEYKNKEIKQENRKLKKENAEQARKLQKLEKMSKQNVKIILRLVWSSVHRKRKTAFGFCASSVVYCRIRAKEWNTHRKRKETTRYDKSAKHSKRRK